MPQIQSHSGLPNDRQYNSAVNSPILTNMQNKFEKGMPKPTRSYDSEFDSPPHTYNVSYKQSPNKDLDENIDK